MDPYNKIVHSRLLYADLILSDNEEKEIINKIKRLGFYEETKNKDNKELNLPTKFKIDNISNFINKFEVSDTDHKLLNYISNVVFWIYNNGILPLKIIIIEIILKTNELQKLEKTNLEHNVWDLSCIIAGIFIEDSIPIISSPEDFHILKFSSKSIPNVLIKNFVAEFVVESKSDFFDDLHKKIDLFEAKISEKDGLKSTTMSDRSKVSTSPNLKKQIKNLNPCLSKIISKEPISFFGDGFSYNQTIINGYSNELFIIGKIVEGSLKNSTPLYLIFMHREDSNIPLINLDKMIVIQSINTFNPLDFSYGAGKILLLQLLNSWNKKVELLINDIAKKGDLVQTKTNVNLKETIKELQNLILYLDINKKFLINYKDALKNLTIPNKKMFLYEFPLPPNNINILLNQDQYEFDKFGPILSNFASLILKEFELNRKQLSDIISIKKSITDILKIEEYRKYSKMMLCFTILIAIATIINIFLFIIKEY